MVERSQVMPGLAAASGKAARNVSTKPAASSLVVPGHATAIGCSFAATVASVQSRCDGSLKSPAMKTAAASVASLASAISASNDFPRSPRPT